MNDVIKVGDTICCHDYADMNDVLTELRRQGYLCTVQVGYTIRDVIMNDVLNVGDTICYHDYADMNDVLAELRRQGYLCKVQIGYTIRIESVPVADPTE